jgi:hypothetical protein
MGERYNPRGYKKNRSTMEKIFFSAPEYVVYETRLGGWLVTQLQKVLAVINEYSAYKIPKTTDNVLRKLIETLTDFISGVLGWMNYFIERRQREGRRKRRRRG